MLWGGREVLLLHPRTPAWEPGLSRGARGCSVLSDRGGPAASPHADSAGPASEHKALVFTVAAHSGLFTRLIWNNKPVPTLLAPASLHPRPVFEDVFKFRAYTQQTPAPGGPALVRGATLGCSGPPGGWASTRGHPGGARRL